MADSNLSLALLPSTRILGGRRRVARTKYLLLFDDFPLWDLAELLFIGWD